MGKARTPVRAYHNEVSVLPLGRLTDLPEGVTHNCSSFDWNYACPLFRDERTQALFCVSNQLGLKLGNVEQKHRVRVGHARGQGDDMHEHDLRTPVLCYS